MNETCIIAEAGINHNGNLDMAKELIDLASSAGCNLIKLQKRTPDICVPEHQKNTIRDTPWGQMTYLEYKHKIEFGKEEYDEIDLYCKQKKIDWFASAWDINSQEFLQQYNLKYNKIASAMLTHKDLLKMVAKEGRHTFISTGMSTIEEIKNAVDIFEKEDCSYTLMACTSTYPCPAEECNVAKIKTLKKLFPGSNGIGYSSHSPGILAPTLAVAMGANVIEVHLCIKRTLFGTDQSSSLEKRGLDLLVRDIKNVPKMIGDGNIKVYDSELPIKKKLRLY